MWYIRFCVRTGNEIIHKSASGLNSDPTTYFTQPAGLTHRPLILLKLDVGTLKLCSHPIIIGGRGAACDPLTACAPHHAATPPY